MGIRSWWARRRKESAEPKIKTAFLIRDYVGSDCVMGTMIAGLEEFQVLERPWKNNQRNLSCIPAGDYTVTFMERSASGKYRNVYHIQGVEGRSGILIHSGNTVNHTLGCLIVGKRRGWLGRRRAVLNSRSGLRQLVDVLGKEPFKLTIVGEQQCLRK